MTIIFPYVYLRSVDEITLTPYSMASAIPMTLDEAERLMNDLARALLRARSRRAAARMEAP